MSQAEQLYPLEVARYLASLYAADIIDYCERLSVVGSVRRGKAAVHDIELLVISLPGTQADLFRVPLPITRLQEQWLSVVAKWSAQPILDGPVLKKVRLPEGIKLEVYLSNVERWGVEAVIRTGPAEFSKKCVTIRRRGGYLPNDCSIGDGWQVSKAGMVLRLPEEGDFLALLGFPRDLAPEMRSETLRPVSAETERGRYAGR